MSFSQSSFRYRNRYGAILVQGMALIIVLLAVAASGCQPDPPSEPLPTAVSLAAQPTTPALLPTATPPPTATTSPTPEPTATPTATATPLPVFILAVPPDWIASAETAVSAVTLVNWHILPTDDPAVTLTTGNADAALVPDADGPIIVTEPLALAVPFTTEWENATAAEVENILANGHPLVTVQPWHSIPPTHKPLRITGLHPLDEGYPLQQSWSLIGTAQTETAVAELTPLFQAAASRPTVHITAVGDLMLARALGYAITQGNLDYPFAPVAEILRKADLTVGNMESALGDIGTPANKSYPFQAPPAAAESLARAGFDVVSLANNHAMDYGPDALLQALDLLQAQNVLPVGAGVNDSDAHKPVITEVNGLRLAFLAYVHVPIEARSGFDTQSWAATATTPGMAWADPERIRQDVTAVSPTVNHVIVLLHSGYEYIEEPSEPQVAAAHAAIDAGAALVIGHHAHILQGIEFYKNGVILYGTGNFAFEIDGDPSTGIFHIWLDESGVRQVELEPAIIQFGGQPRLAEPWEAAPIRRQVYWLTTLLNIR